MKKLMKLAIIMLMIAGMLMISGNVKAVETDPGTTTPGDETEDTTPTEPGDTEGDETEGGEDENELTWSDGSKVRFSINPNGGTYILKVSGLEEGKNYYVYVSNKKAPVVSYDANNKPTNYAFNNSANEGMIDKYLELDGDIYVTVVESQFDVKNNKWEAEEIVTGEKIERPSLAKLGTRIQCGFSAEKSTILLFEPISFKDEGRSVKIKIGTITDKTILQDIKDGKTNALDNLLKYAKTAKSIYTGTLPIGVSNSITSNLGLVNDGYYYVYMEMADESGKYYPIEDVSLYQALVGEEVGANLYDYLSDEFKWNLDGEDNKTPEKPDDKKTDEEDKTVIPDKKLPQTGQTLIGITIGGTILVAAVIFAIKSRKYNI